MLGGVFSHFGLPDGKVRKGRYTVKIADSSSPVTRDLEDFPIEDELYYQLQMMPDVQPLATVEYDGTAWPVAWTRTFGKGRVFHTTLGHRDFGPEKHDPLHDKNLARLVVQGIEWVADGRNTAKE
jgi:type 1 glutamine amidotransferase